MGDVPKSMKAPPIYQEGNSYEEYKKDLHIWQLLKVATAEQEGPIIYRTLSGRAKVACSDLTVDQIGSKDGLSLIIKRLDSVYLSDENQRIFLALDEFEKFKRSPSMTMSTFILAFENLHNKVKIHKCTYPNGALAYRLLKAANVSSEHEQLVKATVETGKFTYECVVEQLKKVFSETPSSSTVSPAIKVENTYHTSNQIPIASNQLEYEEYEDMERPPYEMCQDTELSYNDSCSSPKLPEHDIYYSPSFNRYNNQSRFRSQNRGGNGQFGGNRMFSQRKPMFHTPRGYQRVANSQRYEEGRPPTNTEYKSLKEQYNPNPSIVNPKDNKGNYTICRRCRSIYHWVADCPHNTTEDRSSSSYYTKNAEEEIYIALLQSCTPKSNDEIIGLVAETLSKAVIDSGCSKTVAGENWFNDYLQSLSDDEIANIQYCDSKALFRFGDSKPVMSTKKALLPMMIGKKNIHLATEIVPTDVPLLLSKETMKTAEADIDFKTDSITLFGNKQDLICTSSGHYAIPINQYSQIKSSTNEIDVNDVLLSITNSDMPATAKKLHQQFSHPSSRRLINLVKTSGVEDEELFKSIEKVTERCDTCKRYKKTRPRPVVTFPLAKEFNETVAFDLKTYKKDKIYFMHVIDHATRFSAATVIKSKKTQVIIDDFFKHWVAIFGAPKKVLSDNGGEFASEEFVDMCQNLNINFITTAAEAPWSNGLVENHNGVIGEAVFKILEEVNCSLEVALCWAVNAKNSLQNIFGFSPHQLVFGTNPNLPSVLTDKLPALEGVTGSELIAKHLNAMHKAREEFIKLEASEKLRRALRAQTRTHNDIRYLPGDEVFYKRDDDKRWKGPGRVIGQDGSKVLIKTPVSTISVHSCRVGLTSEAEENRSCADKVKIMKESNKDLDSDDDDDDDESCTTRNDTPDDVHNEIRENPQNMQDLAEDLTEDGNHVNSIRNINELPKTNQCVKYRSIDTGDWTSVKILGRAGKATSKYKNWLNVKNLENDVESSLDWSKDVAEWLPIAHNVLVASLKDDRVEEARLKELENWKNLKVYDEVDYNNQPYVSVKWVYKEKVVNNEIIKKARLVARGYEEDTDDLVTDSPTGNKDSLRTVISIIAAKEWSVNSLNIKAAFLQGKELDREIYLKPPKEAKAVGKVWKLRRCVYGLNDASRYWYLRVKEELLKAGCKCSKADPSVFYYHTQTLEGLLIAHVDDFMWSGTKRFETIMENLKKTFKISQENSTAFTYVGIEVFQDSQGIYVSQKSYVNELQEIEVNSSKRVDKDQKLDEIERKKLRSAIGRLNWLATQSRPDLAYAVSELATDLKEATIKHIFKANKLIRRCKMNNISLFFPKLDLDDIKVRCYADASYGKLANGGSQGGMLIELLSKEMTSPIAWQSKRVSRVVNSVMAAETLAMVNALNAGFLVATLVSELLYDNRKKIQVQAVTDSEALYEASYSTKSLKDRRLRIDVAIIREYIIKNDVVMTWVPSGDQLADILTKEGVDDTKIIEHISTNRVRRI